MAPAPSLGAGSGSVNAPPRATEWRKFYCIRRRLWVTFTKESQSPEVHFVTFGLRAALPALLFALCLLPLSAAAQERAFVQVEAQPTLAAARAAAERYAAEFDAVAGFPLGSGWYAIALGPFADRDAADAVRRQLFAQRRIPADAFVVDEARYSAPFWP